MDSMLSTRLEIRETDEANNFIANYIFSENQAGKSPPSANERVDVHKPKSDPSLWSTKPLFAYLGDVFLPSGYPQSVSDDYLPYQIFDSLQAFCSSIAGLLSSRAVLQGVGVGNADASPTSALLLHILQDTSGRVATILFAHRVGTALEPECKTFRLAADVFNDLAMILDCLSPMVPAGVVRVSVLSTAGVLRALCGVAGGSSKASLSAHFAKWGNLAELNAKDSSQETVISLVGMLVGSVVVSYVTDFTTTWLALLSLLALHLSLNYAAVRAVQMTSLNRQRANIVLSSLFECDPDIEQLLDSPQRRAARRTNLSQSKSNKSPKSSTSKPPPAHKILTPSQVAYQERIFHRGGALQWTSLLNSSSPLSLGNAEIGISLDTFFKRTQYNDVFSNDETQKTRLAPPTLFLFGNASGNTSTSFQISIPMRKLIDLFARESYILFLSPSISAGKYPQWQASILLKKGCTVTTQLKGWAHALLAARILCCSAPTLRRRSSHSKHRGDYSQRTIQDDVFDVVARVLHYLNEEDRFAGHVTALKAGGWDVDIAALETKRGKRVENIGVLQAEKDSSL